MPSSSRAQQGAFEWAASLADGYSVFPDIVYLRADGWESKLDLYVPQGANATPVVLNFHGGGWVGATKEAVILELMPYLQMGLAVANVEYRTSGISLAPGAVEDARCALRWIVSNAAEYRLDPARIVTTGRSSGGHLALIAALLPDGDDFSQRCPGPNPLRVGAVINWFGITDVLDVLRGPRRRLFAVAWFGGQPGADSLARRISPVRHVRVDAPPVLTVHGDRDAVVPLDHAERLHELLKDAGVANELVTIGGGGHGGFRPDATTGAYGRIRDFLARHGLLNRPATSP